MDSGIRAEMKLDGREVCPVARVAEAASESCYSISSTGLSKGDRITEEFVSDANAEFHEESVQKVVSYGSKNVYRLDRERNIGCPCECIEEFGSPVLDAYVERGTLHLTFHATDMDQLSNIVDELRDRYSTLDIKRLIRSTGRGDDHDLVFVERSSLTERQREVLETAHEMGYYDHPKGANAGDVATDLGITTSTFTEHLSAAQSKLLASILDA